MKIRYSAFCICFLLLLTACKEEEGIYTDKLWYDQPAEHWMEALPVGNGRLGAMVFGDPNHERIQLNEDSMWPGGPDWGDGRGTPQDLEEIRKLLKQGRTREVDSLMVERFSYKTIVRSHQTMGELYIDFLEDKSVENYSRELNLDEGVVTITYSSEGHEYFQTVFASNPDDVLVIELSTTNPNGMDFNLKLDRPKDEGRPTVTTNNPSDNEISMMGMVTQFNGKRDSKSLPLDYGVQFETRLRVESETGIISPNNGQLALKNVKKAKLLIVENTSFYHAQGYEQKNAETLAKASNQSFETLLKTHKKDHQRFYNRVDLDLGGKELDSLPINERLQRMKDGFDDPDLGAKLFQFGRYLLIASSRPGTNPANLQGIWNEHITAPWNADYHLNINLQMNYWPAEVTNLSELHQPFFDFLDKVLERGKVTAQKQYGIERGTMAHHASDLWATPFMRAEQAYWGSWIHGGGWGVQHYWEHYRFTQDEEFLRNRAYPTLKGLAEFYLDWLVWDEKSKRWVSVPETSPENSYIAPNGKPAAVSYGSAMGHQIIGEVFDNVLEASEILGIEDDFTREVTAKRDKLFPGVVVGEDGRLLEWNEPYEEPEKGHRHMSHLYALHPGDEITSDNTEAFAAAQRTIDYRLQHGGAGTGWSRAWMINLNARLLDATSATENIKKFFQISVADNLFDEHPPFQIDGNFGYTAAVAELLLQSHEGFIRLLPALPVNWKNGSIKGLKARGDIEVDIEWKDGVLWQVGLRANAKKSIRLKYGEMEVQVNLPKNKKVLLNGNLSR
ncbi:glycoside hydrolase family 95 protein [Maribacter arenosus]|uniref:Glycoside hydrolase family 95 protein n=1 Tax=Maribacter arenosus TaxID=1854708 RepID=A0ABR7VD33_9FLAO|nr:glycoside hydrolase family 95 protein [Maribacter arenosus]MBD0850755.1 glycoside hydrolase family 95 protein [Maribacter arenosus]